MAIQFHLSKDFENLLSHEIGIKPPSHGVDALRTFCMIITGSCYACESAADRMSGRQEVRMYVCRHDMDPCTR